MKDLLEFDSIELKFDTRSVLSSIYMKCQVGEVIGLLGRNGSGKSSMLKIVFGAMSCDYKSIRVNGEHIPDGHVKNRLITYLPQEGLIPSFLSIREATKLFHVAEPDIETLFPEVKDLWKLTPRQLSGGSLRIIESLLILKSPCRFCLLDEPFSGIMPVHIETLSHIINQEKANKGIIITDHLYRHIISLSDRIYILRNGKTYEISNQEELVVHGYVNEL